MKRIFILSIILGLAISGYSQDNTCITYGYDAAGNRVSRMLTVKSYTPPNDKPQDEVVEDSNRSMESIEEPAGTYTVYPNPTFGIINIDRTADVSRQLDVESAILTLTDPNGRIVVQKTIQDIRTQIDVSEQAVGTYVLKIQQADQTKSWQIVKQ